MNTGIATNAVTDEKGAVKYTYAYNPYGELTQGSHGQIMFLLDAHMAGVQGNLATGIFSLNGQIGVAQDFHGNKELYATLGFGVGPAVGGSVGIFTTYTNAPSIRELLGAGYNVGASGGVPVAVGGEVNIMETESGTYYGITQSAAQGGKAEFHVGPSYTFSITDYLIGILDKLAKNYSKKNIMK